MPISAFQTPYHQLQTELQRLNTSLADFSAQPGQLTQQGRALMQLWQRQLADESGETLPETAYSIWRSLHTELYRELRLLNVDLMFLQSSRVATTQAKKLQEIGDRLTKLEQYCDQILKLSD